MSPVYDDSDYVQGVGPREHLLRPALPWRPAEVTECGKDADDVKRVLTRDAFRKMVASLGQERARITACQTCLAAAQRHPEWAKSPSGVIQRWLTPHWQYRGENQLDYELRAIAMLIERHQDEFEGILHGMTSDELRARRKARKR